MTKSRSLRRAVFSLSLVFIAGCGRDDSPSQPEITIAVYAAGPKGPISGPFYHWKADWEKLSGAKLNIVEIPYAQIYERIMADARTGGGQFDGVVAMAFLYGDYLDTGYIRPIDEDLKRPDMPAWDPETVVPALRPLHKWGDHWDGVPNDGDAHILYYRKDILTDPKHQQAFKAKTGKPLEVPPTTWEMLADEAEYFASGIDWNSNGKKDDYGIAMHLAVGGQGYWHFMSLSAPYVVNPGPPGQENRVDRDHNLYWFDPQTMEPLVDSPGHVRALEMLRRLQKTGDPAQTSWQLNEAWSRFLSGEAVFCFSWGDVGRLAEDTRQSAIRGKLGASVLPGTMEVWHRRAGAWKKLDKPNRIANTCGAHWHGVVCRAGRHPDLVYNLFAFHATPRVNLFNVGQGWSGIDPARTYHFLPPGGTAKLEDYTAYGFHPADVVQYTRAYYENYYATRGHLEYLRIPGTQRYHQKLDDELSRACADHTIAAQDTMDRVATGWREITADLETRLGKGRLLKLYQESIGFQP